MLEEYEHAKARGAKIYAEAHRLRPVGRRLSHHRAVRGRRRRVPLHERGDQARRHHAGRDRLHQRARHLDHGRRDRARRGRARASAMRPARSRCRRPSPAIGHLLGAAGAVEAIFSILAIRDSVAPPTINLDNPSVETPIDLVPHKARKREIDVVLSNSFGFGGTNASLVFRRAAALGCAMRTTVHPFAIFGLNLRTCSPRVDMTDAGTSTATRSGESRRVAPRSPRAALEPECVPEPKRPSRRARHPLVIAGNAIFTIILVVAHRGRRWSIRSASSKLEAPGRSTRQDRQYPARPRRARHRRSARARGRHRPALGVHRRRAGAQGARRAEIRRIPVRQADHAARGDRDHRRGQGGAARGHDSRRA